MVLEKRNIAVLTVGRSDYGIYRPVLAQILKHRQLALSLIVTGSHLSKKHGYTIDEIEAEGFRIAARIEPLDEGDTPGNAVQTIAHITANVGRFFERSRPDILLVLGDRFEMLAGALAAVPLNIPIAHIQGGELSIGAYDDSIRHAISKLSHLHFPATVDSAERLMRMGETPESITVAGAPSLDNLHQYVLPDIEEIGRSLGLNLNQSDCLVLATLHAETRSELYPQEQAEIFLKGLEHLNCSIIFTMPNMDPGGLVIAKCIREFCARNSRAWLVDNLGSKNYFGAMKAARVMVGNSSSGIIEAASFGLPVINVGNRQLGRMHGENVVHVPFDAVLIERDILETLETKMRVKTEGAGNVYGDGHASERIVDRLATLVIGEALLMKQFFQPGKSVRSSG
jgi:UDP-hydrolysing UDP-N-acetyl-D-glucosamine 2-epimerase